MTYSASIAFYTIISLPALTGLITTILGFATENDSFEDQLYTQLGRFLGPGSTNQIENLVENSQEIGSTWWAQVIGIGTLIFSATTVFISLQNALNNIWNLKAKPTSSVVKYMVNRVMSFAVVVSMGFILLVSLALDSVLLVLKEYITAMLSSFGALLIQAVNVGLTLVLVAAIFTFIFKYLPDAVVTWKAARQGGLFTALLFIIGKIALNIYLTGTDVGSAYGAAGSLVLFLTWVYYSSVILLFGASYTFEISKIDGYSIKPSKHAVFIQEVEKKELLTPEKLA